MISSKGRMNKEQKLVSADLLIIDYDRRTREPVTKKWSNTKINHSARDLGLRKFNDRRTIKQPNITKQEIPAS